MTGYPNSNINCNLIVGNETIGTNESEPIAVTENILIQIDNVTNEGNCSFNKSIEEYDALFGKMVLFWIIEYNRIDAYFRSG